MHFHRSTSFVALLVLALAGPTWAQEQRQPRPEQSVAAGALSLLPVDSVTEHSFGTAADTLRYTATAGTIDLFGRDGAQSAKIFYTAYVAKDQTPTRPLTFVFNGGPGAASAYLHLGLVGPKALEFGDRQDDGTTPSLKDNPDSWLAFTDLVLIDPVGTGWSRAVSNDAARSFHGVSQDAESLAKTIALYTQKNGRLASPKYLLGESYGGFRAAKVASALKDSQGILVSGILMVSPMIEGRFLFGAETDPLSAALRLPSLAAAELERKNTFRPELVAEAERFAMNEYLVSLAGPFPKGDTADALYSRVSGLTGIPREVVSRTRGFVSNVYTRQSTSPDRVVTPYDAAYSVADAFPEAATDRNDDPILDGYTRAYGSAFAAYARDELGFKTEMTYTLLNEEVNRRWEWNGGHDGQGRAAASAERDLRDLLSVIPKFRLMVAHGYSDTLTPYGFTRYVLDHLPPCARRGPRGSQALSWRPHVLYAPWLAQRVFQRRTSVLCRA